MVMVTMRFILVFHQRLDRMMLHGEHIFLNKDLMVRFLQPQHIYFVMVWKLPTIFDQLDMQWQI